MAVHARACPDGPRRTLDGDAPGSRGRGHLFHGAVARSVSGDARGGKQAGDRGEQANAPARPSLSPAQKELCCPSFDPPLSDEPVHVFGFEANHTFLPGEVVGTGTLPAGRQCRQSPRECRGVGEIRRKVAYLSASLMSQCPQFVKQFALLRAGIYITAPQHDDPCLKALQQVAAEQRAHTAQPARDETGLTGANFGHAGSISSLDGRGREFQRPQSADQPPAFTPCDLGFTDGLEQFAPQKIHAQTGRGNIDKGTVRSCFPGKSGSQRGQHGPPWVHFITGAGAYRPVGQHMQTGNLAASLDSPGQCRGQGEQAAHVGLITRWPQEAPIHQAVGRCIFLVE